MLLLGGYPDGGSAKNQRRLAIHGSRGNEPQEEFTYET
jgi:hypothetical protein